MIINNIFKTIDLEEQYTYSSEEYIRGDNFPYLL